jgi:uracil-DNA glycosylase
MYDSIISYLPDIKGKYYPEKTNDVFRAFKYFYYKTETKLLILGQDPYKSRVACGLAFGQYTNRPTGSLKNILEELSEDIGIDNNKIVDLELETWAKQGILLLNTGLTVGRNGVSHMEEWKEFIMAVLVSLPKNTVCLCMGAKAKSLCDRFVKKICVPHPSPINKTTMFRGSKPFSKVNELLKTEGITINWNSITGKEKKC